MGRLTNPTDDNVQVPALGVWVPAHGGVDVDDAELQAVFPDGTHPLLRVRVGDAPGHEQDEKPAKKAASGRKEH